MCYILSVPIVNGESMNTTKNMVHIGNCKGQNVIEYLLLTATVVILLVTFMKTSNSPMKNAMDNIYNDTVDGVASLNAELKFSSPAN